MKVFELGPENPSATTFPQGTLVAGNSPGQEREGDPGGRVEENRSCGFDLLT